MKPSAAMSGFFRLFPAWKGSLLLFGFLIGIVLAYFYWQVQQSYQTFLTHVREHTRMLAGVIELNARNALLSQEAVEEILTVFLGSTARFVDYLDAVEPFSRQELTEFSLENNLAGVRIIRKQEDITEGPPGWPPPEAACGDGKEILRHLPSAHLYILTRPRTGLPGCVMVGLKAGVIERLHDQIGLSRVLETISGLTGITDVRIEAVPDVLSVNPSEVILTEEDGHGIARARLPLGENVLTVGLETRHFFARTRHLWNEFFVFSAVLAVLGGFFSWLLHRSQTAYIRRIRTVERELARQHEDAALGRAAAAITHEIRNPLNAIGMGLQRIQIEVEELEPEYQALLGDLLQAVRRTNGIVENIRRFAKPLHLKAGTQTELDAVVNHILSLYQQRLADQAVHVQWNIRQNVTVAGDPGLLEQAVENLVKNAAEAQPDGGFLRVTLQGQGREGILIFENGGFTLPEKDSERMIEPYFTTKTRGTGLGLAIVRRIIHAHGGSLSIEVPEAGMVRLTVRLPEAGKEQHENSRSR